MVAETKRKPTTNVWLSQTITLGEAHNLIDAGLSDRDRMLLLILWSTGCRISEAIMVRARDYLPADPSLRLPNRKQSDARAVKHVALSPAVAAEIDSYIATNGLQGTDFLIAGRSRQSHLCVRQARNVVYGAAGRAGVTLISPRDNTLRVAWPHSLRHSNITHLLRNGVDLLTVAEQAGHSNVANTRRYAHLVMADRTAKLAGVKF